MPIQPPPDKPDKPSPMPPVNDGIKRPKIEELKTVLPEDAPVRKET